MHECMRAGTRARKHACAQARMCACAHALVHMLSCTGAGACGAPAQSVVDASCTVDLWMRPRRGLDSVCPWHNRLLALRSRYPCLAVQVSAECVYAYCRRTCLYKSQTSCPPANVGRDAVIRAAGPPAPRFFSSGT
eukprot:UN3361